MLFLISQRILQLHFFGAVDNSDQKPDFLRDFSMDENKGYEKYEKETDNIHYTCFLYDKGEDRYHPNFVVCTEYIGSEQYSNTSIEAMYIQNEYKDSQAMMGKTSSNTRCIFGTATDFTGTFTGKIHYYKEYPFDGPGAGWNLKIWK